MAQEVSGQLVVACVDAPEVLDAAESILDQMALTIAFKSTSSSTFMVPGLCRGMCTGGGVSRASSRR